MSPSELANLLRRTFDRAGAPLDEARREAELNALSAAHARRFDGRPRRAARWLLPTVLVAAAAVGACVVPIDYEAEMGQRLAFVMSEARISELDIEAIARFIEEEHNPEEIRIQAHAEVTYDDPEQARGWQHPRDEVSGVKEMRVEIEAIGDDLDADEIWDDLVAEFPALAEAHREDEALSGVVHGTLGGRLSHAWLDVTIDRHGVEEAKRQLIEQLAAQGVQGTAEIEIIDEELGHMHRREVRVRLDASSPPPAQ